MKSERRCVVRVSADMLATFLVEGSSHRFDCVSGVPEGARLISSAYDPERHAFVCLFAHDSFDDIVEGALIPELPVSMRDRREPA